MASKLLSNTIRAVLAGSSICAAGLAAAGETTENANDTRPLKTAIEEPQEIVVTATRREAKILDIPYNISAVTGEDLAQKGITDITAISRVMPGLDYPNQGAGRDTYSTPIIRGLNLTPTNQNFYPLGAESPVSTYIGDTPVSGRFPLNDIQRVEVLRGPQGTLYGAGAIGGTIRLIPADPQLGAVEARVETSVSSLKHSREPSYSVDGVVNLPVSDLIAFRLSAEYKADAGFIDAANLVKRISNQPSAPAILSNPNDVAGSGSIRETDRDVNWSESYGGRAALLAKLADTFTLNISLDYSHVGGGDNPAINTTFGGGPDSVDPRIHVPATGSYRQLDYILQPYHRDSTLPAMDLSWDVGFATPHRTPRIFIRAE